MPQSAAAGLFQATAPPTDAACPSARSARPDQSPLPRLAEISQIVEHVVASWHAPSAVAEQRRSHRTSYERPAVITPLDDRTGEPLDQHEIVSGRDISPAGFSFTHLDPLACRRAIVTFAFERDSWDAVMIKLSWCRFTRSGIYQSGGKFLGRIASPISLGQILDELPYA